MNLRETHDQALADGKRIERERIRKLALEPSEAMIRRLSKTLCCHNGCQAPANRDYLRGIVSICQSHTYEDDARAVLRAFTEEIGE